MSNFSLMYQFRSIWFGVGVLILFTLMPWAGMVSSSPDIGYAIAQSAPDLEKLEARALENYAQIPLYFGQIDAQVRYFARAEGYGLFLTSGRIAFALDLNESSAIPESSSTDTDATPDSRYGLFLDFIGSNAQASVIGESQNAGISNYFRGNQENWITDDYTTSTELSFPVLVGPDLTYNGGLTDAFIAKVNPVGTGLAYAGYIGGDRSESGYGIAVDWTRQAYISGFTSSKSVTFPIAGGGDFIQHGLEDVILTVISSDGTTLNYSGYWGGQGDERGTSLALAADGTIYITGLTDSSETTFPVTIGPDLTYNDNGLYADAFIAKFSSIYLPASGVTITESDGATIVGEDGATDSYTILLQTPPTADVTITIVPAPQLEVNG